MLLTIIPLATNSGSFARASSGRSTTSNTLDQAAIKSLRQQQERFETSVDSRRAIALALASTEFQQMTSRSIWAFNSIFDRFTFTLSAFGVSVVPQNVNVVYSLVAPGFSRSQHSRDRGPSPFERTHGDNPRSTPLQRNRKRLAQLFRIRIR